MFLPVKLVKYGVLNGTMSFSLLYGHNTLYKSLMGLEALGQNGFH